MDYSKNLKELVKEKYGQIAKEAGDGCSSSCCGDDKVDYTIMSDDYTQMDGYSEDADLHLGCGLPTQFAQIKKGDTVVDLGSGAGNDCFIALSETGPTGSVIGIDMTEAMIEKARENVKKLGVNNVKFILGDIEAVPLEENTADVVVSNCVFNLVPDKKAAFEETYRILKKGGHFSISDIVLRGILPESLKNDAEMYAGCVAGAVQQDEYLSYIRDAGFQQIEIQKEKEIILPDEILKNYLTDTALTNFKNSNLGIFSITVFGRK